MPRAIHLYRPQRTPPEYLEAISVGREPLLDEILSKLKQWEPGKSRQHYLIIGPRGIGKTYLIRILEHRILKSPKMSKKWCPISLAEESYRITSVTDLLIEALRILSEESRDSNMKKAYDQVKSDKNEDRVIDLTLDAFRLFHKNKGCGILLMIENLNRVLERQIRHRPEIHLLRKILIEEEWLMAVCTSPTYLRAVTKPEEPLFEFFHIQLLSELTPDQQRELLYKLAILEENYAFERELRGRFRARLQALYHFTGGNPRLIIMLYDLIANKRIREVKTELDFLLDEITPFYQDRMKDIPEKEGKLLVTMAIMPEGCTPTELAKEARIESKVVRALMTRLTKSGYIRREQRRDKKTVYIIPERFFRIWHQMLHSRAARRRVQYLFEFFSFWYATKEQRDEVWNELTSKFKQGLEEGDEERIEDVTEYMEYIAEVSKGSEKIQREFGRLRHIAITSGMEFIKEELTFLDRKYQENGDYFVYKGIFLANDLEEHESALTSFQKAMELKKNDVVPLFNAAVALDKLGYEYEASQTYKKTASLLYRQIYRKKIRDTDSEVFKMPLQILRENRSFSTVKIAAYLLGRLVDIDIADDIIAILKTSELSWRRQHCATALGLLEAQEAVQVLIEFLKDKTNNVRGSAATALGRIGSELAVDPLIECLKDEARDVRGSAANALGHIGSELAVDPLIKCLKDEDSNVRGSAVTALGRIASEIPIPNLSQVMDAFIEETLESPKEQLESAVQILLRSVFRSANLGLIHDTIEVVTSRLDDAEELCAPYVAALKYLRSDRDPAVMERQHPEMREAVQLLVEVFDEGLTRISTPIAQ